MLYSDKAVLTASSGAAVLPNPPTDKPKYAPDAAVMERIKWCESRNNPNARNPNSTAKGLYQFLDGSWEYYGKKLWGTTNDRNVFDPEDNEELAYYVASVNGYKDWEASRYCWSK